MKVIISEWFNRVNMVIDVTAAPETNENSAHEIGLLVNTYIFGYFLMAITSVLIPRHRQY